MSNDAYKSTMKFWGKFIVYLGQVLAVVSLIKGEFYIGLALIMVIFIGCMLHEYSED